MRSVSLNKTMRSEILSSVMDQWKQENPEPDKAHASDKFAQKVWKKYYKNDLLKLEKAPQRFLKKTSAVNICVNGEVLRLDLKDGLPRDWASEYNIPVLESMDDGDKRYSEYKAVIDAHDSWSKECDLIRRETKAIIDSVNTTKQLLDLWPQVHDFLPAYLSDPDKAIKLPAIKVSRLNERLGIK